MIMEHSIDMESENCNGYQELNEIVLNDTSVEEKSNVPVSELVNNGDAGTNISAGRVLLAEDSTDIGDTSRVSTPAVSTQDPDQTDAASVYSLFMERDARYFFQHPYSRLAVAYLVVIANFLVYAEDPVAHSVKESHVPVIGNDFSFLFTKYPRNRLTKLKFILWMCGIISGLVLGKLLFHEMLFKRYFKLKMFQKSHGSWMTMFMTVLVCLLIFSYIYNGCLYIAGEEAQEYIITTAMGITNGFFMKGAACGTWCGDFFTAWMVTDIMLQEKLYPHWAHNIRKWWKEGFHRIVLFWTSMSATTFIVVFIIATDYINWDRLNHGFLPSNELTRSFGASFILVMDIIIVTQDWDFPHFINNLEIKLPGMNRPEFRFYAPKFISENWHIHITGKWFNYGILFCVIILDLNMWKNQLFYKPYDYGQYVGADNRIYTVLSTEQLGIHNESMVSFEWRNSTINPETNKTFVMEDPVMNSRFMNYSMATKSIAFIPCLLAFVALGVTVSVFGRFKPTKEDPYAGRLKKRKRKRFSFFRKSKRTSPESDTTFVGMTDYLQELVRWHFTTK
ncbi:transmembrane protein 117 isoform X1 [Octopus bimaculoides]|uniref:transmembrane protein 117 isoform X1 n=1 Tax=Octopus bimaculoides TaxID=37653 RepID=UPI00071D8831|nr:transmembrane protein 117 isoform X1 [Octopus bimaculoides]XP_052824274.1 transmembrane protein 117 isoform X1 [Octopus bimaculoides]|eukprot:XP_014780206.1 PREDICTED: transmembrane protein 117-like isoform X1 [Octopus bimaculoides]